MIKVGFNKPCVVGKELYYIAQAVENMHISGDGPFTKRCHSYLEKELGVPKALLTTNCTHALEMSALLLNLQPGDEVIVPSFTFVSTVNAFVLRGAKAVFADIRPDTLNIDERKLESLMTARTKAIYVVHYAGVACEMDAIMGIARKNNVQVIEDNAHGLFGKYKGRWLGSIGCMATQSFHETKNFTCGEGGALFINDAQFIERAEIIREKGTNRARFFRGQVDKYTWCDIGSSYLPSDILAAYLWAQFEARDRIQAKRQMIWEFYNSALADWAQCHEVVTPTVPAHCEQSYHMYYILLPTLEIRQRLIAHLKAAGITAVFHYLPLHLSEMGKQQGGKVGDCPITEDMSDRLLRLPFHNELTSADLEEVAHALASFEF